MSRRVGARSHTAAAEFSMAARSSVNGALA